jgi:hypothetical protein
MVMADFSSQHVRVRPQSNDGFTVELFMSEGEYAVHFNGWHEHFTSLDEALDCFIFGLSEKCRLREHRRFGIAYKWTVEGRDGDRWVEDSTTGLMLPLFGKGEVRLLQNSLVN